MGNRNILIPVVIGTTGKVHKFEDGPIVCSVGPGTGWYDWLKRNKSFHYEGLSASMTVTGEKRKRGRGTLYFYGWKTINGKKRKKYLGPAEALDQALLEKKSEELAQLELDETPGLQEKDQWKARPKKRQPQSKRKYQPPMPEKAMAQMSFLDSMS